MYVKGNTLTKVVVGKNCCMMMMMMSATHSWPTGGHVTVRIKFPTCYVTEDITSSFHLKIHTNWNRNSKAPRYKPDISWVNGNVTLDKREESRGSRSLSAPALDLRVTLNTVNASTRHEEFTVFLPGRGSPRIRSGKQRPGHPYRWD